ncbi:preprotein translocase subunit SecG [Candidatus Saccharibacteria bacterium]|nr:preprotein translocase subunit SecG [Candidatus Saccharibacteria bacterium]
MDISSVLQFAIFISAILLVLLILLQSRGASLGSGSGASSEIITTRRGLEKSMFVTTVVFACIFVGSIIGLLIV